MTPVSEITLHGHRITYRTAGRGPLLVLLHGIAGSSETWEGVIPALAARFTVLAPDLLGHGASPRSTGDFSLGAYANAVRDLLEALGHGRGTIVGHSLGGGVAMQFAYQFPERCQRLVLVSSGGLGRELHPLLRAAALPGAEFVLPWLSAAGDRGVREVAHMLRRVGFRASADLEEAWRGFASLRAPDARRAFIQTVREIIDVGGQRVSAHELLYLTEEMPALIVWGENDPLIPVRHGVEAHARMPGSRLEVFPRAGHFPYLEDPLRFVSVLIEFVQSTKPLRTDPTRLGSRLRAGPKPAAA